MKTNFLYNKVLGILHAYTQTPAAGADAGDNAKLKAILAMQDKYKSNELKSAHDVFAANNPSLVGTVRLQPYSKKSGQRLMSYRKSLQFVRQFNADPAGIGKDWRFIAGLDKRDIIISRVIAQVLVSLLEGPAAGRDVFLYPGSYGFRPGIGTHQALDALEKQAFNNAREYIFRTDLKSFFDRINVDVLINKLRELFMLAGHDEPRLVDWIEAFCRAQRVYQWMVQRGMRRDNRFMLDMPNGNQVSTRTNVEMFTPDLIQSGMVDGIGIPQGNPLSAPLANLYLTGLDFALDKLGRENDFRLIRYADDIVLACRNMESPANLQAMVEDAINAEGLGLELSANKTDMKNIKSGEVNFLGYGWSMDKDKHVTKHILAEKVEKFKKKIKKCTDREGILRELKKDNKKTNLENIIATVIFSVNRRISPSFTMDGDEEPTVSSHSFLAQYRHGQETEIFKQMQDIDFYIRMRVACCVEEGKGRSIDEKMRTFFSITLPKYNEQCRKKGHGEMAILSLTGLFYLDPHLTVANSYGVGA